MKRITTTSRRRAVAHDRVQRDPAMIDPMGRHREQPADIRLGPMDARHVQLTAHQVADLPEYSRSYPSGTYDGKCWLRKNDATRWLCWYVPCDIPGQIGISRREILVIDGGANGAP